MDSNGKAASSGLCAAVVLLRYPEAVSRVPLTLRAASVPAKKSVPERFGDTPAMKLRAAYLSMHRAFDQLFRQSGVTADQFVLLRALAEEQGITQKELSTRICSDENTVAAMISLLERKAIIRREIASNDGRARLVFLTRAGRSLLRAITRRSAGLHRIVARCFEEPDRTPACRVLDRIAIAASAARSAGRRRSNESA